MLLLCVVVVASSSTTIDMMKRNKRPSCTFLENNVTAQQRAMRNESFREEEREENEQQQRAKQDRSDQKDKADGMEWMEQKGASKQAKATQRKLHSRSSRTAFINAFACQASAIAIETRSFER